MLIKIKPGVFINPDHVVRIAQSVHDQELNTTTDDWLITTTDGDRQTVSNAAAAYLLEIMEASQAVILPGEKGFTSIQHPASSISSQPLTSRIAQLLRDTFVQGASVDMIAKDLNVNIYEVIAAIGKLVKERVAVYPGTGEVYYHATHAPRSTPPTPEVDLAAFVQFDPHLLEDGSLLCTSCEHVSCSRCITAKACCQCRQPNFLFRQTPTKRQDLPENHTLECLTNINTQGTNICTCDSYKHSQLTSKKFQSPYCVICNCLPSAPLHDPQYGNHLFNEPLKTNPDPLVAIAAQGLSLAGYNEKTEGQTIADLCDLCGYPRSSQIHLNNCVPLGVLE